MICYNGRRITVDAKSVTIREAADILRRKLLAAWIVLLMIIGCVPQHPSIPGDIHEDVRPDQMADLVVSPLTAIPAYPAPGEQVEIRVIVYNQATVDVRNTEIALYVAGKQVVTKHIGVAAEDSTAVEFSWVSGKPGTYMLIVEADPDHRIMESDGRNNTTSLEVAIAPPSAVETDLLVSNIEVVSLEDQPRILRVTVDNKGQSIAQAPLSIRADDRSVAVRLVGPISPGASVPVDTPWPEQLPLTQLSAEINPRYRYDETDSQNNSLVVDPRPSVDLRVYDLSVSAAKPEPTRARQVTVSFRITNEGKEVISTPFRTSVFPGKAKPGRPSFSLDTYYLSTARLGDGRTIYVSRTVTLPTNVEKFEVSVEADVDHVVNEANEENNIFTLNFSDSVSDVGRWFSIGPRRINRGNGVVGRLRAIAIHPADPLTIYTGEKGSGLWKTTNGGSSWQPVADSLPTLNIAAIAITPSDLAVVYIATPVGIFRSGDAGTSWSQISDDLNIKPRYTKLLVYPTDSNVLYLSSRNGIYRGTYQPSDATCQWQLSNSQGKTTDLVMHPNDPNILYAAFPGQGIFKTTNGGITGDADWVNLTPADLIVDISHASSITLAICRDQPSTLYAALRGGLAPVYKLYRTDNSGATWDLRFASDKRSIFNDVIGVDPENPDIVYITGVKFRRSTDGGLSFPTANKAGHVDQHGLAVGRHPDNPNIIYAANDGGLFRSENRGDNGTWAFIGDGIANVELYDFADATTEPDVLVGGTQDNAVVHYDGASTAWEHSAGGLKIGDEGAVDIDPTNARRQYAVGLGISDFYRRYDSGAWKKMGSGLPQEDCNVSYEFGPQNNHFLVHPSTPSTLLATCGSVYRTQISHYPNPPGDWTGSWASIFDPPSGKIVRLVVDPTVDLYYAGSNEGKIFAGPAGAGWVEVFSHPTSERVTDIEIDLDDPITLYVCFRGTGGYRVYRLRRSSTTPITMTGSNITSDLPKGLSAKTMAVDRMMPLTIYIGTNNGVYRGRSTDDGATWSWSPYNNGLPSAVSITDLEVHPTTGVMRASTYGRSAYAVNTDSPIGSVLAAEGKVTLLRVHDVGTKYGPPTDQIDVEVVIWLDSKPGKAFGFQLRDDENENARRRMLDLLRDAFNKRNRIGIEYIRTGFRNGIIIRVMEIP